MKNGKSVEENLITLISKLWKITLEEQDILIIKDQISTTFIIHLKKYWKIVAMVQISANTKKDLKEIGNKLAMHIAAQSPIAIDEKGIKKEILDKELEIIKEELKSSGKKAEMIDKIATGKIKKFISDNTLLNQVWIMDTKMKVNQVLKKFSDDEEIKILDFSRFKVGEGVD